MATHFELGTPWVREYPGVPKRTLYVRSIRDGVITLSEKRPEGSEPVKNSQQVESGLPSGRIDSMPLTQEQFDARLATLNSKLDEAVAPARTAKDMLKKVPFRTEVKGQLFTFDSNRNMNCNEHGRPFAECPLSCREEKSPHALDFVDQVLKSHGV